MDDYLTRAVANIADPQQAEEVRRELTSHLADAISEYESQGYDRPAAEEMAVKQMGPVEETSRRFGVVYHEHLPWRYYLAIVPLLGMAVTPLLVSSPVRFMPRWFLFLVICLLPKTAFVWLKTTARNLIRRFSPYRLGAKAARSLFRTGAFVRRDAIAKWYWVTANLHIRSCMTGIAVGILIGLSLGGLPEVLYRLEFPSPDLPKGYIPDTFFFLPLIVGLLILSATRRFHRAPLPLLAALVPIGFPVGFLPTYMVGWWPTASDWPIMTLYLAFATYILLLPMTAVSERLYRWRRQPVKG